MWYLYVPYVHLLDFLNLCRSTTGDCKLAVKRNGVCFTVINLVSIIGTNLNPKFEYAPLKNIGCESQFSKLDNHINITGGSTSIQTI